MPLTIIWRIWIHNSWKTDSMARRGELRLYRAIQIKPHPFLICCINRRLFNRLHGPPTRYIKLRVAHAPGMPGAFSPPPTSIETACYRPRHASRHVRRARAVMYVGIANPRWQGKLSRRMRNPQFYVSGKRPIEIQTCWWPFYRFWNQYSCMKYVVFLFNFHDFFLQRIHLTITLHWFR